MPEHCHPVLIEAPDHPAYDVLPGGEAERAALPARFHIPQWYESGRPPAFVCAVCWGDGWVAEWPCVTAQQHGAEIFAKGVELNRYRAALSAGPVPDLRSRTEEKPGANPELAKAVLAAITDPRSITARVNAEALDEWQLRAVLEAIRPYLAGPSPEQMLREFHSGAGLPLPDEPTARPELGSQTGRAKILAEEVKELGDAIDAGDITEIADACADVVYAVVGTAVTYGLPFDAVLAEVHRSNMTKLIPPVQVNDDGKIVKGPGYESPDIARVLGLGGKPVQR